jgi:hypothetical protein
VCFSASANFVGSAVLGTIGVATLTEVKHRRELLFAAMPLLFALHQFTEGFVWLGLDHKLPALSVLLNEPTRDRRRRMLGFSIVGAVLALYGRQYGH